VSRLAAAALTALALVVLGACGGADIAYTEVKSDPAPLPIPQDQGTAADTSAGDDSGVTTSKTRATPTPVVDGSATTPSTEATTTAPPTTPPVSPPTAPPAGTVPAPEPESGTGGTTPTAPTAPEEPPADTGGATAGEGLDQFCADNPGACNGGN